MLQIVAAAGQPCLFLSVISKLRPDGSASQNAATISIDAATRATVNEALVGLGLIADTLINIGSAMAQAVAET
jgi:hypothetical protein